MGGKLSIAVNSIPGFSISGEGEINMDESNREFYESITCKVNPTLVVHKYNLRQIVSWRAETIPEKVKISRQINGVKKSEMN